MIEVPQQFHNIINSAAADGCPVVAASVDLDGQPQLAYYGTLQLLDDNRLGWWARKPENLLARLAANARMTFIYWNVSERVLLRFYATAMLTTDPADREAIFTGSPDNEKALDPDRLGAAFVADLHLVTGFSAGQPLRIE